MGIAERLREEGSGYGIAPSIVRREAADEIERLTALLEEAEAALEEADKRLCALTPSFPPDVGPDMRDVKSIEETGAVVMQIRALLAKLHEGGE